MDSHETASQVVDRCLEDVKAAMPLTRMVTSALDSLAAASPCPVWDTYRELDVEDDVRSTEAALVEAIGNHSPPAELSGVWFGLYEIGESLDPADTQSVIAVSGGRTFPDENWLFEQDWHVPGYLPTPVLRSMPGAAAPFGSDVFWLVTYALTFVHTVGLVAEVARGPAGQRLLDGRESIGVAVGFHDGDIALLGSLTESGLDTTRLDWA